MRTEEAISFGNHAIIGIFGGCSVGGMGRPEARPEEVKKRVIEKGVERQRWGIWGSRNSRPGGGRTPKTARNPGWLKPKICA